MSRPVKCPTCGKPTLFTSENAFRPFCSERCKLIDLGQWAEEKYAIPVQNMNDIEEENEDSGDGENDDHGAASTSRKGHGSGSSSSPSAH